MKNSYEVEVKAQCPCNPQDTDCYKFTIESESIILVEKIAAFFEQYAGVKETYQEALTQKCAVTLGAKVTSVGWHHGIKVTCQC